MKKNLLLFFAFLFSVFTNAQQETNTTFATQMNSVFGPLDKTKVPHGVLLDYGMEFTNVPAYNGTLTDSTYSDKSTLKQIYNTLLSSRVREVGTGWITPGEYDTRWNNNRTTGVITLGGVYFKYAKFADNALTANKLTFSNNKFYDKIVSGVWQNPYQELQTFAMASPIKQYDDLSFQIKIPSNTFLSNYQNLVTSIQVDFDNGLGYIIVPFDQNLTVSYTTYGTKVWKYKLNLNNGTSLYNQSRIKIGNSTNNGQTGPPVPPPCETCRISPSESPMNIVATIPYLGGLGSVKITIDYAGEPSQGIKKPLIVAEGFDLGVILEPEKRGGNYSYGDFRRSLEISGIELRSLIHDSNKEYDIIYVDWDNGVDYMQRNAYALEAVIKYVNARKVLSGSTTKNVVLGQSMGGVIARYALADMEQRGEDHQTELFISHDAPQQGANIPIALQYMYRHITRQYIQAGHTLLGGVVTIPIAENYGVSNYLSILDAPASRQLLKNSINLDYSTNTTISSDFYDELKTKGLSGSGGYPLQCRNIAISNGSECGSMQNFSPGDDLVSFQYNKGLNFIGDLLSMVYLPLGGSLGGALVDSDLFGVGLLGLVPGRSKYNLDFRVKSLYDSPGNQIYKGRVSYTKKVLYVMNVTVDIMNVQKNQPVGILPFDTYGGGFYDTKLVTGTLDVPNLVIKDHFNFIPTASALDIGGRNVALTDADYKKGYVGALPLVAPKNTPFANFSTDFDRLNPNAHNKQHISFNTRNGNWLAAELNALQDATVIPEKLNCSFACSDVQISGDNITCGGAYSVPINDSCNWTITEGANLVNLTGNGTNTINITPSTATASGKVTLSVFLGNGDCGFRTFTKTIWVGKPSVSIYQPPVSTCNTILQLKSVDTATLQEQGVTNIQWIRNGEELSGNNYSFGGTYEPILIKITNSCGTTILDSYIPLRLPTKCGVAPLRVANSNTTEVDANYKIYPNPSSEILNVSLNDGKNIFSKNVTASLYDLKGVQKKQFEIINNNAAINVADLPEGIYILKINIDGTEETHQIIVN